MDKKLQALLASFEAKKSELDGLVAKDDPTQEDITKATGLRDELKGIRTEIEQVRSLVDDASTANEFLNAPKNALPFQGTKDAAVVGMSSAGTTVIEKDEKGASLLHQDGECLISEAHYRAISEPGYSKAFRTWLRAKGKQADMSDIDRKTLQEGNDAAGGFLVPVDILNRLIQKKPTPTRVRDFVTSLTTGRDTLAIPKVNYSTDDLYTTGMRVTWTGEVPSSATVHRATDPVFGQVQVPINTAMISVPLTNDFLEDAMFPIGQWIADKFRETIELLEDNEILNGPGITGRPSGILKNPNGTNEPAQVVSGSASALTADGLLALAYAVPEQYDENCRFIFNKTATALAIAQLKDGSNRYLFSTGQYADAGIATARPGTLLGYPYSYSGFMPSPGTNTYPVIFGDPMGYYLVRRVGLSVRILSELYAETNQVLALGRVRFGGVVAEEWRLKIQKCST